MTRYRFEPAQRRGDAVATVGGRSALAVARGRRTTASGASTLNVRTRAAPPRTRLPPCPRDGDTVSARPAPRDARRGNVCHIGSFRRRVCPPWCPLGHKKSPLSRRVRIQAGPFRPLPLSRNWMVERAPLVPLRRSSGTRRALEICVARSPRRGSMGSIFEHRRPATSVRRVGERSYPLTGQRSPTD
jgi:hypothetical protein